jgi:hypothetical protein
MTVYGLQKEFTIGNFDFSKLRAGVLGLSFI